MANIIEFDAAIHRFRIGDTVADMGISVPDPRTERADLYKASDLKVIERGPEPDTAAPHPDGGIAPALEVYRANGHRRLDRTNWECFRCPCGLDMVTDIIVGNGCPDHHAIILPSFSDRWTKPAKPSTSMMRYL